MRFIVKNHLGLFFTFLPTALCLIFQKKILAKPSENRLVGQNFTKAVKEFLHSLGI